ncbi:MAG: hypothetical protein JKY52_20430 [Flavobacteriales bacterium]|nr:hypothetical protein [Flavobacteriales bacterium]
MDRTYRQETNFLTVIWVALTCVLTGGMIGATTNAFNGYVSPTYFQNILGWDFHDIWTASIAQGILEGLIYGVIFSIVFGATVLLVTKGQATYRFAFRHLIKIIGLVYLCWCLGGLIAVGLAALSPDFYRATFKQVPEDFGQMLGYAWVGGSIWGGMFGGLFGLTLGVLGVRTSWRKNKKHVC